MTRLALVLGLLALLASGVGLSVGRAAGPAHATSIFYYPWYGNPQFDGSYEHWDQNGHVPPYDLASSFYPARGPYSSADPKIVAAQMNEIAAAGIREVVSSWWGWGSPEDLRLPMIVQMARKAGLEVAAQIEPYDDRTAEGVAADIGHLRTLGVGRFYVYHPFLIADSDWQAALPTVTGVQVLAQTTNVLRAKTDRFGGVYTYDVSNYGPATFGPLCQKAHSLGLVCAPSVGPGYDALRATGDTHIKERAGGATYDAMWKAAIQAGADRVTITSYNEWHEGTQIEPALTSIPRRLETAARPSSSPVAQAYETYNGAFGLKGRQASRAYLIRTAYWTGIYRSGILTGATPNAGGKAAAHGRNVRLEAEDRATVTR
jgi:glycoprotein endo-alpha-1,2-mannosidase